ncbi:MAG: hypothetical protein Q7S10_03550 [bacterium]|nr:hypothetical protein [bacterium]
MSKINQFDLFPQPLWTVCMEKVSEYTGLLNLGIIKIDSRDFGLLQNHPDGLRRWPNERHMLTCQVFQHPRLSMLVYVVLYEHYGRVVSEANGQPCWMRFWEILPMPVIPHSAPASYGPGARDFFNPDLLQLASVNCDWEHLYLCPGIGTAIFTKYPDCWVPTCHFQPMTTANRKEDNPDLLPDMLGNLVNRILRETNILRYVVRGNLQHIEGLMPCGMATTFLALQCPTGCDSFWSQFPFGKLLVSEKEVCAKEYEEYLARAKPIIIRYLP